MKKFTDFLQKTLTPAANKFAQLTFVAILRDAIMVILPLSIVGAFGTLLANLPFEALANILSPAYPFFNGLSSVTSNIMGLAVAMSMGYFTAQKYKMNTIIGAITSVVAFLASQLTEVLNISLENFGATGIITAIILGYFSVWIAFLFKKYKIQIKMPDSVPPMVADSFSPIISLLVTTGIVVELRIGLGLDINQALSTLLSPITASVNTLPGLLLIYCLYSFCFLCGINSAVVSAFVMLIAFMNVEFNAIAVAAGQQPEYIYSWPFSIFMITGGTGITIGLAILCLFSKSKRYSTLGKLSIAPALFNINEPLIYGLPIMFNPIMAIPFILTPIVCCASTYLLMATGIIAIPFVSIPWTLPPVLSGYLATAGDWRTAIWTGILVIISILIYFPFFKVLEKQELENEAKKEIEV